jgi:hypothetical protein
MRRRDVLKYVSAGTAVTATGCLSKGGGTPDDSNDESNGDGSEDGNENDGEPNDDDATTASLTDTNLEVVGDNGEEDATVEFGAENVRVSGAIFGNNLCYTARLAGTEYDEEAESLAVDVESFDDADDEACAEEVVNIGYNFVAEFEGGTPTEVEVRHNGETMTEAERGTHTDVDGGIESTEFRVVGTRNAESQNPDNAEIEFDDENGRVIVEGKIRGSDGCKTAVLESAEYDADKDEVSLEVGTRVRDDANRRMCTEALVEIDYIAEVYFDGEIPNNASVSHDDRANFGAAYASERVSEGGR